MNTHVAILQAMPVFGGLREPVLSHISEHARSISRDTGSYFFCEGDQATSLFVLNQGKVGVFKNWHGSETLLCEIASGDCFGEMAIMDMMPRSASVRALEPCTAIEISTENLREIYELDSDQYTMLQMNLGREVSRRLRRNDELLFRLLMGDEVSSDSAVIIST
jgi:CRP/FNR family transcriptional regulator, cyclic AMP receptor protein